ncbi:hypothetical protein ACFSCX_23970 [Bacillus salitolerans]|uniref:Uncharacterized protein n=1 Tax=Bacillus salitolerans TaxID=1437434 RepID=A0ABW4LZ92_9BACI
MSVIFSDYGIEISEEDGRYFLNFDEGELVPKLRTIEVTLEETKKGMLSPKDAYEVIIAFQNRERRDNMNSKEKLLITP